MPAQVSKPKRRLENEPAFYSLKETPEACILQRMLENVPLKNVPLDERRREANKPLYLFRYE